MGYYPLITIKTQSSLILPLLLRSGEHYTSYDAETVLKPLIRALKDYSLVLLGDSGLATQAIDSTLFDQETGQEERSYAKFNYRANSWQGFDTRVVSEATRPANEIIVDTIELVTSFEKLLPEEIFHFYRQRGEMGNIIKELKEGFTFGKTDSSEFAVNQVRRYLSAFAYNIVQLFKHNFIPQERGTGIAKMRFDYFHVGGRIISHARQTIIELSTNYENYKAWSSLMITVIEWFTKSE